MVELRTIAVAGQSVVLVACGLGVHIVRAGGESRVIGVITKDGEGWRIAEHIETTWREFHHTEEEALGALIAHDQRTAKPSTHAARTAYIRAHSPGIFATVSASRVHESLPLLDKMGLALLLAAKAYNEAEQTAKDYSTMVESQNKRRGDGRDQT